MYAIIVPAIQLYNPPIQYDSLTAAVRRAKQIATVYPNATVDIHHSGRPVFALGASQFGGASGLIPHRCWSTFQKINGFAR